MVDNMKDNGKKIICMEKELTHGKSKLIYIYIYIIFKKL
jgi:hypothetical protein